VEDRVMSSTDNSVSENENDVKESIAVNEWMVKV
jgi:hypothetical protein